jgi:hypothetical protein
VRQGERSTLDEADASVKESQKSFHIRLV